MIKNIFFQIFFLSKYDLFAERVKTFLFPWVHVIQRRIAKGVDSEYLCKFFNTLGSKGVMILRSGLCKSGTDV